MSKLLDFICLAAKLGKSNTANILCVLAMVNWVACCFINRLLKGCLGLGISDRFFVSW